VKLSNEKFPFVGATLNGKEVVHVEFAKGSAATAE
jgi:hypothetical protein